MECQDIENFRAILDIDGIVNFMHNYRLHIEHDPIAVLEFDFMKELMTNDDKAK